MPRILRSATKKLQNREDLSMLTISNKPKIIQRDKKTSEIKNENNHKSDIWNINSIMSSIFAYTAYKDLVEFSTVCKKWKSQIDPVIYKTIKLNRRWDIMRQIYGKSLGNTVIDDEVAECISCNAKNAPFVKEFKYNCYLGPRSAIEAFETFRFITNLTIEHSLMSQDQFLGMINPLTQLRELNLINLQIKRITYRRLYKEVVQLPPSLNKLKLESIFLINNPELFIQTINSHNNLVEFSTNSFQENEFLQPFYKHYPSLLNFELNNINQTTQPLITVFEKNPQLVNLKLMLNVLNSELISHISSILTNLEALDLSEYYKYSHDYSGTDLKFSQPIKIKKLNLCICRISNCLLNSILQNCPHLEDLALNRYENYQRPASDLFVRLSKPVKLKKLAINCDVLSEGVFDSVLLNCPNLIEINIRLPIEWKAVIKSIYEKCKSLQKLHISIPSQIYEVELDHFCQEFYKTEIFTSNPKFKLTLRHLTLDGFKAADSKAEHFKNFKSLKCVNYPSQHNIGFSSLDQKIHIDMDLWPSYILLKKDNGSAYDFEFKKI